MRSAGMNTTLWQRQGFRFVLFGLESVNQNTLDKLQKALKVEQIAEGFQNGKRRDSNPM